MILTAILLNSASVDVEMINLDSNKLGLVVIVDVLILWMMR